MFEALNVPIMFTAPYSYDCCPCELFFALLKSTDINPEKAATGKKAFAQVVQLVHQQVQAISRKPQIMQLWHHVYMHVLRYLDQHPV